MEKFMTSPGISLLDNTTPKSYEGVGSTLHRCFPKGGRALVRDESGFAKQGEGSAGVARQWNGRMGKVDNCQVGVFAALTTDQFQCDPGGLSRNGLSSHGKGREICRRDWS
jgi:hypothetical protein